VPELQCPGRMDTKHFRGRQALAVVKASAAERSSWRALRIDPARPYAGLWRTAGRRGARHLRGDGCYDGSS